MNISKKTAVILILGIVLLLIGFFLYFYLSPDNTTPTGITPNSSSTVPFGDTSKPKPDTTDVYPNEPSTSTPAVSDKPAETLRQIFPEPTSGSLVYTKNKDAVVRFVERSNGNIYEVRKDSPQAIRLTNKTIPKIQEVVWDKSGSSVVLRYLDENREGQIDSFAGKIKIATSTSNEFFGDITGTFLPINIPQIVTNPGSGKIAYFQNKLNSGGVSIFTANTDGTNKIQVADISLSEINISWPKESTIAVITKPSSRYAGFLYFVNTQDGVLRKVLGDLWGLNVLISSQTNKVVYSRITRNEPVLGFYDMSTGEDINLQIKTFADKCVWGKKDSGIIFCSVPNYIPNGTYPDNWYQGEVSFADNIWKIDLETGMSTMIYDLASDSLSIDAVSLSISDKDDFLVFTNKIDLSLWGLILE